MKTSDLTEIEIKGDVVLDDIHLEDSWKDLIKENLLSRFENNIFTFLNESIQDYFSSRSIADDNFSSFNLLSSKKWESPISMIIEKNRTCPRKLMKCIWKVNPWLASFVNGEKHKPILSIELNQLINWFLNGTKPFNTSKILNSDEWYKFDAQIFSIFKKNPSLRRKIIDFEMSQLSEAIRPEKAMLILNRLITDEDSFRNNLDQYKDLLPIKIWTKLLAPNQAPFFMRYGLVNKEVVRERIEEWLSTAIPSKMIPLILEGISSPEVFSDWAIKNLCVFRQEELKILYERNILKPEHIKIFLRKKEPDGFSMGDIDLLKISPKDYGVEILSRKDVWSKTLSPKNYFEIKDSGLISDDLLDQIKNEWVLSSSLKNGIELVWHHILLPSDLSRAVHHWKIEEESLSDILKAIKLGIIEKSHFSPSFKKWCSQYKPFELLPFAHAKILEPSEYYNRVKSWANGANRFIEVKEWLRIDFIKVNDISRTAINHALDSWNVGDAILLSQKSEQIKNFVITRVRDYIKKNGLKAILRFVNENILTTEDLLLNFADYFKASLEHSPSQILSRKEFNDDLTYNLYLRLINEAKKSSQIRLNTPIPGKNSLNKDDLSKLNLEELNFGQIIQIVNDNIEYKDQLLTRLRQRFISLKVKDIINWYHRGIIRNEDLVQLKEKIVEESSPNELCFFAYAAPSLFSEQKCRISNWLSSQELLFMKSQFPAYFLNQDEIDELIKQKISESETFKPLEISYLYTKEYIARDTAIKFSKLLWGAKLPS
jgi:hypothetical protein